MLRLPVLSAEDRHAPDGYHCVRWRYIKERLSLVGTLFQPDDGGPYPGILLLGGSEGGLHEDDAALLAAHGYAVLALAYFGMAGVPPLLIGIPLEYGEAAIAWLREQEGVRGDWLGAMGGSRGGELALLLGVTFPAITPVVSQCGSGVLTEGIGVTRCPTCSRGCLPHSRPKPAAAALSI